MLKLIIRLKGIPFNKAEQSSVYQRWRVHGQFIDHVYLGDSVTQLAQRYCSHLFIFKNISLPLSHRISRRCTVRI